jgi:hypothetical protein
MKRLTAFAALALGLGIGAPEYAESGGITIPYSTPTSAPHGVATCMTTVKISGVAGDTVTVRVTPAPASGSGENGGEIQITGPRGLHRASDGHENATPAPCDVFPDGNPTDTKTFSRRSKSLFPLSFLVHSHPDADCLAAGVATGTIRLSSPTLANSAFSAGPVACDNDESNANLLAEVIRFATGVRTDRPGSLGVEIVNHGPGIAQDPAFVADFPQHVAILDARANGEACPVTLTKTDPPLRRVRCPLEMQFEGDNDFVNIDFGARQDGSFVTTMRGTTGNDGVLTQPTTVRTNVQQGSDATLYVSAKSSNNGTGSVSISPAGAVGTANPSVSTPDGQNTEVTVDNYYSSTTSVTLTANPGPGATVRWSGACSGVAATTMTCKVNLSPPDVKSVSVRFRNP